VRPRKDPRQKCTEDLESSRIPASRTSRRRISRNQTRPHLRLDQMILFATSKLTTPESLGGSFTSYHRLHRHHRSVTLSMGRGKVEYRLAIAVVPRHHRSVCDRFHRRHGALGFSGGKQTAHKPQHRHVFGRAQRWDVMQWSWPSHHQRKIMIPSRIRPRPNIYSASATRKPSTGASSMVKGRSFRSHIRSIHATFYPSRGQTGPECRFSAAEAPRRRSRRSSSTPAGRRPTRRGRRGGSGPGPPGVGSRIARAFRPGPPAQNRGEEGANGPNAVIARPSKGGRKHCRRGSLRSRPAGPVQFARHRAASAETSAVRPRPGRASCNTLAPARRFRPR